jgi:hypothetical protein
MANEVFDFHWRVPETGHEWTQTILPTSKPESRPKWVLTDKLGPTYRVRMYPPLKTHSGLYRTFADLNPRDRDGILKFANAYGMLGIWERVDRPVETWQTWLREARS